MLCARLWGFSGKRYSPCPQIGVQAVQNDQSGGHLVPGKVLCMRGDWPSKGNSNPERRGGDRVGVVRRWPRNLDRRLEVTILGPEAGIQTGK